jgi:hypothetical protein
MGTKNSVCMRDVWYGVVEFNQKRRVCEDQQQQQQQQQQNILIYNNHHFHEQILIYTIYIQFIYMYIYI